MEKVKLYTQNGDSFLGSDYTKSQALKILKEYHYTKYYQGRDSFDNVLAIVGIDKNNTVNIEQRRKNGLLRATCKAL